MQAKALDGKGLQESWLICKHCLLQSQEKLTPLKKSSRGSKTHTDKQAAPRKIQIEEESL